MSVPKNKSVKVSIVISVYNAGKRIEDVARALLAQQFSGQFEIILVNDGSTDNSLDVMNRLRKRSPKIRVFTQKNKGAAAGRNLGIRNAQGRYIVISDDDVILESNWLRKAIPLLKEDAKSRKKTGLIYSVIKNNPP
jgi:glycosyltransferase involved in cell wall biosynthesis